MTLQLQSSSFEHRPHSHHGIATHSPAPSPPRIQRPVSQASVHLAPQSVLPSPAPNHEQFSALPYTSLPYRPYQPGGFPLPSPQQQFAYPSSAPPMAFYPSSNAYDPRSMPMMRTVSHAHPLNSADQTASSRYSSSPHLTAMDAPASASYQWQMGTPALSVQEPTERHINPSVFSNNSNYPMSRSTSGASDAAEAQRLLTPHFEYREQLSPAAADIRKVSDTLGGQRYQGLERYNAPQGYPQPQPQYWGRDPQTGYQYAVKQEPQYQQQEVAPEPENDYERERMEQISGNRKLLETLGLGGQPRPARQMSTSDMRGRKVTTPKRRLPVDADQVRSSPRIASQHRNVSYMDLDGVPGSEHSDDSYEDDVIYEEDDFRPAKRGKGYKQSRKASYAPRARKQDVQLSLWGLLQVYPQIPDLYPLFYYTLNNDLTINPDSVPLIGSIPSTVTPLEKADILRGYFQRGRRVLAQLDNFTGRSDRKYEGPEERWPEMDHHTRIAVRDVRRKIVERCENYKYTRRDILDKNVGKHKWQQIEIGMIEWKFGITVGDPAGDLSNVTLTLPTPPPGAMIQQQQQQQLGPDYHQQRVIRPMPSRSRLVSSANRSASITMVEPSSAPSFPGTALSLPYGGAHYGSLSPAPPMYGEDQVPMTVQMPVLMGTPMPSAALAPPMSAPGMASMDPRASVGVHTPIHVMSSSPMAGEAAGGDARGVKRERSGSAHTEPESEEE